MNGELEKACCKNLYDKIHQIIESKTTKPSLQYKDLHLTKIDFDYLKTYSEEKAMACLCRDEPIPCALVKLSSILGDEHMAGLEKSVCNYITTQAAAELAHFISANFTNLASLKCIYEYLEKSVERVSEKHVSLPAGWSIELRLVTRAFALIKQRICDYLFVTDVDEESFVRGLIATIALEKKLKPFFQTQSCCQQQEKTAPGKAKAHSRQLQICCMHERMLSTIFVSCINLYFSNSLRPLVEAHFDQGTCRMSIIGAFLDFFREAARIYECLAYFDEESIFHEFLGQTDHYLLMLLRKIKINEQLEGAIVVMNTLAYVQETMQDLAEKIRERYGTNAMLRAYDEMIRIEKHQGHKVERLFSQRLGRLGPARFGELRGIFEEMVFGIADLSDELRCVLAEIATSQLFARISTMKMSLGTAEALLGDICDFENYLMTRHTCVPHIKTIKEYLKIFACPCDDKKRFVENFKLLSGDVFSFCQILSAMENQDDAAELFLEYKKSQK